MDPGAIPGTSIIHLTREARSIRLAAFSFREAESAFRQDSELDMPC